ncbi:MAG: SusC/RagA family TonB-linked outer membrane protein [Flavobacteriales bacterium]
MRTKCTKILTTFLLFAAGIFYAQVQVSGVVKDDAGEPLPGVYVESASGESVETDVDGKYTIEAKQGEQLTFSFIGMDDIVKTVSGSSMNITMGIEEGNVIGDVVVTGMGIKRQSRSLGWAATKVTGEELTEVATSNPLETLSGKVPGVDISSPAQPGASTKVIVRGLSSITGSNSPLYVVDGSPIQNNSASIIGSTSSFDAGTGVNDIDPNNIESINFLKGAAATALYGSRGSNGVILITTKKGKNRLRVDVSSSVDFSEVARVPHFQTQFGQGWSGLAYSNVTGEGLMVASNENGSWGPAFDGVIRPWGRIINNQQQIKPYVGLEDNMRNFYDTGSTFTNSITISGGNDESDVALTYSTVNSDGVIPTSQDAFRKSNVGINAGLKYDKFRIRGSGNYTHKNQNAVPTGQGDDAGFGKSLTQELIQIPNDISIVDMEDQNNIFNTPSNFFTPYAANPYVTLASNNVRIQKDRFYGNINLGYDITKKLSANFQTGIDIDNEYVKRWGAIINYEPGSPQANAQANGVVGAVQEAKYTRREYDTYFNLNYLTDLTNDLTLGAYGGFAYNERNGNSLSVKVTNLDLEDFYEISNSAQTPTLDQNDYKRRVIGVFGQTELGYKNRYFLTLTARNDWSSTLPTENNSYFYPSASLSAVVIDNGNSFLKLRGAWARVGNDTNMYLVNSTAGQSTNDAYFGSIEYPLGGVNGYETYGIIENEELEPEITDEIEFGFEGRILKGRLGLDVALYNRVTNGLIVNVPVAGSTGYSTITGNFVDLRNRGIELMLTAKPIKSENFKWDLTYTFTKNDSEVLDVMGDTSKINLYDAYGTNFYAEKGKPLGVFYTPGPLTVDGKYVVNPNTGYYVKDGSEQYAGSSQRDFIMGLRNVFSYKNFRLSMSFDWKQGGEMYSYTKRLSYFVGNGIETTYNDRNPFIIPNSVVDNGNGTYSENTTPVSFEDVTAFYNTSQNAAIENQHVIDKTFIRMRDLSFGYKLPNHLLEGTGVRDIIFSVYGKNLFLWTPDGNPYVDPETTSYGSGLRSEFGEFATNPSQRTYGFNIKLSF